MFKNDIESVGLKNIHVYGLFLFACIIIFAPCVLMKFCVVDDTWIARLGIQKHLWWKMDWSQGRPLFIYLLQVTGLINGIFGIGIAVLNLWRGVGVFLLAGFLLFLFLYYGNHSKDRRFIICFLLITVSLPSFQILGALAPHFIIACILSIFGVMLWSIDDENYGRYKKILYMLIGVIFILLSLMIYQTSSFVVVSISLVRLLLEVDRGEGEDKFKEELITFLKTNMLFVLSVSIYYITWKLLYVGGNTYTYSPSAVFDVNFIQSLKNYLNIRPAMLANLWFVGNDENASIAVIFRVATMFAFLHIIAHIVTRKIKVVYIVLTLIFLLYSVAVCDSVNYLVGKPKFSYITALAPTIIVGYVFTYSAYNLLCRINKRFHGYAVVVGCSVALFTAQFVLIMYVAVPNHLCHRYLVSTMNSNKERIESCERLHLVSRKKPLYERGRQEYSYDSISIDSFAIGAMILAIYDSKLEKHGKTITISNTVVTQQKEISPEEKKMITFVIDADF